MATMHCATCKQRVSESILLPRGEYASHGALKGCKSYIHYSREEGRADVGRARGDAQC